MIALGAVFLLNLVSVVAACLFIGDKGPKTTIHMIAFALVTVVIDIAVMMQLLNTVTRAGKLYDVDVTNSLERSLVEYREQAARDESIARDAGASVEQHLARARTALSSGDVEATQDQMLRGVSLSTDKIAARCDNVVVASVLASKARQCADLGIRLVSSVTLPEQMDLDDVEVASLFFNLIDNAMCECEELRGDGDHDGGDRAGDHDRDGAVTADDEPVIAVEARIQAGQLFMKVTNPCRKGAENRRRNAVQKADATMYHGLGTGIVEDISQRHGGITEFRERDCAFIAIVMIPL